PSPRRGCARWSLSRNATWRSSSPRRATPSVTPLVWRGSPASFSTGCCENTGCAETSSGEPENPERILGGDPAELVHRHAAQLGDELGGPGDEGGLVALAAM